MAVLTIYICGKPYQLACDPGQEAQVAQLAQEFDVRVRSVVGGLGQVNDSLAFLMAALTLADEVGELKRDNESLKRQVMSLEKETKLRKVSKKAATAGTQDLLDHAAEKVETLASKLPAAGDR